MLEIACKHLHARYRVVAEIADIICIYRYRGVVWLRMASLEKAEFPSPPREPSRDNTSDEGMQLCEENFFI